MTRRLAFPAALLAVALVAAACGDDAPVGADRAVTEVEFDREPFVVVDSQIVAVDLDGDGVETVTIDGTNSRDLDGEVVSHEFSRGLEAVSFQETYTDEFPIGEHVVTLRVTDDDGLSDHQAIVVRVLVPYQKFAEGSPDIDLWGPGLLYDVQPTTNQRWLNITGNVQDDDGILELTWSLNGSSDQPLSLGPNARRLVRDGDFNIDIPRTSLLLGDNAVEITAVDTQGDRTTALVQIKNEAKPGPEFPLTIDWSDEETLEGIVEIVDGAWEIDAAAGRVVIPFEQAGYDRLLSIGDVEWSEYDVTTSVIVEQINEEISTHSGGLRGFGFLLRWNGHNDAVSPGSQPQAGFIPDFGRNPTPFGGFPIFHFQPSGQAFVMQSHRAQIVDALEDIEVELGQEYSIRGQVQSITGGGAVYRAKLWPMGEEEPDWQVIYVAGTGSDFEPARGSLILLSHEAATSWGSVHIRAIEDEERLSAGEISALQARQDDF